MPSLSDLEALEKAFSEALRKVDTLDAWEEVRIQFFGKKRGKFKEFLAILKTLPPEEKKAFGKRLNELKTSCEAQLKKKKEALQSKQASRRSMEDLTLPGWHPFYGHYHPVTQIRREVEDIFHRMGFWVEDGPEIEDDFHNFEALNIPPYHPARNEQDTFYLKPPFLLRTHTSNIQIRAMTKTKPPLYVLAPGRVFRRDDSPRHSPVFHQVEGFGVDENLNFPEFKGILIYFLQELFGKDTSIRFRPSYFPFTEPSAEVDIACVFCQGKGCQVCSNTGWMEILGAGMIHPQVLRNVEIDPEHYQGFAFGMGLDRVAMLKFGIPHIRLLFDSSAYFLEQF